MDSIKTLVLSGGGGRGAFHAGVYRYLSETQKQFVDTAHQAEWKPDIIVGTSIGAVNGAAIAQGYSAEELVEFWLDLREKDIQGLPPGMSWLARVIVNRLMKTLIGTRLDPVDPSFSTASQTPNHWLPIPGIGRWASLLDTGPLQKTLQTKMKFDSDKIHHSLTTLLINTTNIHTGELRIFSNKPIYKKETGEVRKDVVSGISIKRVLASCSIPLVYPWTVDEATGETYWDGAVVSNTPLGAAFDAAGDISVDIPMEIVVVLMTPWRYQQDQNHREMPGNIGEGITWALDWALLASFRERLALIEAYNQLARIGQQTGDAELSKYREAKVIIVAPDDFFPAARILDYDERNGKLIDLGYQAAEKAFQRQFPI